MKNLYLTFLIIGTMTFLVAFFQNVFGPMQLPPLALFGTSMSIGPFIIFFFLLSLAMGVALTLFMQETLSGMKNKSSGQFDL